MAYDLNQLAVVAQRRMENAPVILLKDLATQLGVDRHTVSRALRLKFGSSYRELQRQCILRRLAALSCGQPRSRKELAYAIGYSHPTSLARILRRANQSKSAPPGPKLRQPDS